MSDLIRNGEIRLFGTIIEDKMIWPEDVGYFSSVMVLDALSQMQGDVRVLVNSNGGSPSEGEAVRAAFEAHPGKVTVVVTGSAHSAASLMVMAADRIEMSAGSLMLIHDPSTSAYGTAADLGDAAGRMDAMADAYAGVYAARAGISPEDARAIMRAETMYSADAAVAAGFADAVGGAPVAMSVDPAPLERDAALVAVRAAMSQAHAAQMRFEARPDGAGLEVDETNSTETGVSKMSKDNKQPVVTPVDPAAPAAPAASEVTMAAPVVDPVMQADVQRDERARVKAIMESYEVSKDHVSKADLDRMIADGTSIAEANAFMMAAHAAAAPRTTRIDVTRDERDTKRIGMTEAAVAQMLGRDPTDDRARAYMEMDFVEMAVDLTGAARPRSVGAKSDVLMSAGHSTSDFPLILANAFNTVIEDAYDVVDPTFGAFSREMTFNDFRAHDIVRPDNFPTLQKIGESGEIKFGTFGESKESIVLASYATGLSVSRQLMINDNMGAIADVLNNAAAIVPEFEEETFWAMLLSNPSLSDDVAVFHADHGNIGANGAINTANVAVGRKAMRVHKQKDGRSIKNNAPAFLIVGPERETEAEQFLAPVLAAEQLNINPLAKSLKLVVTEEITDTSWMLAVDPARKTHCFKHGYLDGYRAPRVRVDDPFGSQGTRMSIEHDFAVGAVGYMGAYKRG